MSFRWAQVWWQLHRLAPARWLHGKVLEFEVRARGGDSWAGARDNTTTAKTTRVFGNQNQGCWNSKTAF